MQGEDLPQATNRVDLDPTIRDIHGLPVARTTYHPHRHELAASAYYAPKLEAVLKEAGALWSQSTTSPRLGTDFIGSLGTDLVGRLDIDFIEEMWEMASIPTSRHVVGTVRMGTDPATSVCDEWGRLHDVPNVVIADSSPFPDRGRLRAHANTGRPVDPQFARPHRLTPHNATWRSVGRHRRTPPDIGREPRWALGLSESNFAKWNQRHRAPTGVWQPGASIPTHALANDKVPNSSVRYSSQIAPGRRSDVEAS